MIAPPRLAASLTPAQRLERLGGAVILSLLLGASFVLPPHHPLPFDACPLHRLAGLPCLTCGLTRAVCLLAHGQWRDSLAMHPAGGLAFAALVVGMVWAAAEAAASRALHPRLMRGLATGVLWSGGVLSAVAWTVRLVIR